MSVRRGPRKQRDFTILDNAALCDERLSFRARGVLAFILSKPDGWRTNSESLARVAKEGRDAIRSALRELKEAGYIVYEKIQDAVTGRWSTVSTVYEQPVEPGQSPVPPRPGKPASGKPPVGKSGANRQRTDYKGRRPTTTHSSAKAAAKSASVVVGDASDGRLKDLEQACRERGLIARFDAVKAEKVDAIAELIDVHGVEALAAHALKMHSTANPTKWVGGLLPFWSAMPAPRRSAAAKPDCDLCENGWYGADYDIPCPTCRPNLTRVAA
ncbi:helix-turn-helix domain-containing protein [Rhodococcus opacus]|uniref:Replication protein n=1 Tax=Rhodococcus opacus TaxID=37919 RepID=A0A2S8JAX3_RHOOP|nr:helix-turn-helix domain-containing protein [Rhodococcus opacus]PQP24184.1 replication protein [Rhodococcus opacus]